jgi:hypothetical protein
MNTQSTAARINDDAESLMIIFDFQKNHCFLPKAVPPKRRRYDCSDHRWKINCATGA